MLFKSWLNAFSVPKIELKVARSLALATAFIALIIIIWSSFFAIQPDKHAAKDNQITTHTTDATNLTHSTVHHPPTSSPQQHLTHQEEATIPSQQQVAQPIDPLKNKPQAAAPQLIKLVLGQGSYYVQVGAFSQAKLAKRMLEKMRNKYRYAKIQEKSDNHAVWVGPVNSKQQAKILRKHLRQKSNIQGFIVTEK